MNRLAKHAAALALWMIPGAVLALGLGEIHVNSRLNEALDAEIELLYTDPGEAQATEVNLASAEDFRRVGLDRGAIAVPLRFGVEQDSAGRYLIRVTSSQPVGEPFLDFLIEVNWPNGRLLREYVVLLDPPVTTPAEAAPLAEAPPAAEPTPAPAPRREQPRPAFDDDGSYEVVRGDTLWEIARDHRPSGDVTINQMMIMLYRMNPEAFFRDNINALKAGAVLRLPELDQLRELPVATALAQVRTQNQAWEGYRQSWAARTPTVSDAGVSPEYVRPQPSAPAVDDSRLELVPPAGEADASELASLRAELARSREDLVSAGQENVELQSRIGELENLVSNLERAITLKDADLADLQNQIELTGLEPPAGPPVSDPGLEPPTAVDAGAVEDGALATQGFETAPDAGEAASPGTPGDEAGTPDQAAATEPAGAAADVGVTPAPPRRRPEPGLVDRIGDAVSNPLVLGGLGAALLLGLGGFLWSRRRAEPATGGTLVDRMVAASEAAAVPPFAEEEADRVDAEAEGEDEAALIAAIEQEPEDPQTHLALLRLYYAGDQADEFAAAAQRMLNNIGGESHPAWMEVKAMGANLAPDHPLFAAAEEAADDEEFGFGAGDLDDETETVVGPPPGFDADALDLDQAEAEDDLSLDFELEEGDLPDLDSSPEEAPPFATADDDDLSLDFDLGPEDLPKTGEDEDELTLAGADVSEAADDLLEPDSDLGTPADTLEELEIEDLDLGEEATAEEVPEAAPADEADTEFELQALSADGEADTELDLDLDLDSTEESATEEEAVDPEQVRKQSATLAELEASDEDLGLDDLDLDDKAFGDDDAVGTKLDLAKAYIDMGDPEGARGMLEEVLAEGNPGQKEEAEDLLGRLTP